MRQSVWSDAPEGAIGPQSERSLRIWSAVIMWIAGGSLIALGPAIEAVDHGYRTQRFGLAGLTFAIALFSACVFPRLGDRALYRATNFFCFSSLIVLGCQIEWSGSHVSSYIEVLIFPVIYASYFFSARAAVVHVAGATLAAMSPLASGYDSNSHFISRVTLVLLTFWAAGVVINVFRGRLLAAELRARGQSLTDPLTGLANLRAFRASATKALSDWEHADRDPRLEPAIVLIDLDDFKEANTRLGHNGGDAVLYCTGSALSDCVAPDDVVARVGGDELAVLTYGRSGSELIAFSATCGDAIRTAGRTGLGHPVTASIGAASASVAGCKLDELVGAADRALFEAKAAGKDCSLVSTVPFKFKPLAEPSYLRAAQVEPPRHVITERKDPRFQAAMCIAAWLGAAAAVALSTAMPDADRTHLSQLVALIGIAFVVGLAWIPFRKGAAEWAYLSSDAAAAILIVSFAAWSGGAQSPVLPVVLVTVAFAAYFMSPGQAAVRLAGAGAVLASPFLYENSVEASAYILKFTVLLSTAAVLGGLLIYSRRGLVTAEMRARLLALRDPLTGLANRRDFENEMMRLLAEQKVVGISRTPAARPAQTLAVVFVDLDNFKQANSAHGHAGGDLVLRSVATAMRAAVRPCDIVARIGGDEFAVLAPDADEQLASELARACVKAAGAGAQRAGLQDCGVTASAGFAVLGVHGNTQSELMRAADRAMMSVKSAGKGAAAEAQLA